ncbi:MAG: T9SS type A sorting domain-containing protein [Saprospiraceae bacterium]
MILKHTNLSITRGSPLSRSLMPLLLLLLAGSAQSQSVIGSLGGEGNVGSMNLQYTAGEAFVTTIEDNGSALTQGFHQPCLVVTSVEETFLPGAVTVFPNPTAAIVNVRFADIKLENLRISLFDAAGKSILTSSVHAELWQTDLSGLAGGYYLLKVTDLETHQSNSFKIFKSN